MNSEKEKIQLETYKIHWFELQRFFAKGKAIWISTQLNLIKVVRHFSIDDKRKVNEWINSNTQLWAVVINPFILVQKIHKPI
jgi:hypothetical protein